MSHLNFLRLCAVVERCPMIFPDLQRVGKGMEAPQRVGAGSQLIL
jgi:hypothetical protein